MLNQKEEEEKNQQRSYTVAAAAAAAAGPKCTKIGPAQPSPVDEGTRSFPGKWWKAYPAQSLSIHPVAMVTGRRFHLS